MTSEELGIKYVDGGKRDVATKVVTIEVTDDDEPPSGPGPSG